jgi:hypothetical protein
LVQAVFFLNQLQTAVGIAILLAWIAVFLLTVLSLSGKFSEGSTEWYQQGLTLMTGIIVAMVIGFILGYDLYGILLLAPFGIMAAFIFSWLFVDRSEDYMNKDLERLQKEIK